MGKNNLLLGTARGKLGDVVFYRTGGEQRFRTRVRPTNPRTNAQLLQRAVVSTVVKGYSPLVSVCDHAFQNFDGKLKNQERFMRINIMAFRPIALSMVLRWSPISWSSEKIYNWAKKDDINAYVNPYIISEGDLPSLAMAWGDSQAYDTIELPTIVLPGLSDVQNAQQITYRNIIESLGLNAGDQLTFIIQTANGITGAIESTKISRIILMPSNGDIDSQAFTSGQGSIFEWANPNRENYGEAMFTVQKGTGAAANQWGLQIVSFQENTDNRKVAAAGVITSRFENEMWRRSNSKMIVKSDFQNLSSLENAVASYMKSDTSSMYLNQATTSQQTDALNARDAIVFSSEAVLTEEQPKKERKK